ncbi:MAG: transglutaminase domain-containing protein [Planctomycetales bacterium]|nr:transglutaminase domain-containing protein [Planctomycetales bacterium]
MPRTSDRPLAVERYLIQLELAAKQQIGVIPAEILDDAESHLSRDLECLLQVEPNLQDSAIFKHFVRTYGTPSSVAEAYQSSNQKRNRELPGCAPNWRIYCPKCGRSAPLAKVGVTRIGARSYGKLTLGWCRECRRMRWLRIERDLNRSTIVSPQPTSLGHWLAWILAIVILIGLPFTAIHPLFVFQTANSKSSVPAFQSLPNGWTMEREIEVPRKQLEQFSQKLGFELKSLVNTFLSRRGEKLQINTLTTLRSTDAAKLATLLRKSKSNPRWIVDSEGIVYEFVVRQESETRLANLARYAFPIIPRTMKYLVEFDAVPVSADKPGGPPDGRNQLFNLLLQPPQTAPSEAFDKLAQSFDYGSQIRVLRSLEGAAEASWVSLPAHEVSRRSASDTFVFSFENLPLRHTLPVVHLSARIQINSDAIRTISETEDLSQWLSPTKHFPIDAPAIRKVVETICQPNDTPKTKLSCLLDWFQDSANIRYAGVTGSRYGTMNVLSQGYGHCWDYADLFNTLARAMSLPCREVYGWLQNGEGHVWNDVLVDGKWQMIDPTTGIECGSDYIPLSISADGEMTWIYASSIQIERL